MKKFLIGILIGLGLVGTIATAEVGDGIDYTAYISKMQMTDSATGDVWCFWIANGEWQKTKGECKSADTAVTVAQSPAPAPVETLHAEEAPSVGDIIQDAAASLLNSVWQFTKWALQASLQGAVKLVPDGIKSFSAGLASFVVQDVKSDLLQLFSQIKSITNFFKI